MQRVHSYEGDLFYPLAGSELIVMPTIVNAGSTAASVTLELDLPAGSVFERSFTSDAVCADGGFSVSCTLPTLAPGAALTPDLLMRVPATTGYKTLVAALRAGSLGRVDTYPTNFYVVPRDAQLSLQLLPSLTNVAAGATLSETMHIENSGIHYTTPLTVEATTDPALTPFSVTGAGCSLAPIRCTNIVLGPGESIDITFGLHASNTSTLAAFTGSVTSFTTDPVTADADIVIGGDVASTVTTMTADHDSATPGQPMTYTVQVTNSGPGDAYNVKTQIELTSEGTISSTEGTGLTNCAIQQQRYIVDCDTPTLARGATATGTVSVIPPLGLELGLKATTTMLNGPSQPVSVLTPVAWLQNDAVLTVAEGAQSTMAGQRSTLHFYVANAGAGDAANVFFDATFGAGLALASIKTSAGSCVGTHCAIGTLKAGATELVTLTVEGVSVGAQRINAAVSCDAENGPLQNNASSAMINVTAARSRGAHH
ncbi:MAG TPA: hypothetical protein VGJ82_04815 [Thermoanaerobaculia bacterium]